MTSELRRYLLAEHVAGSAVVNFVINGVLAWLSFRHFERVPLWGTQSIGGDLVGTTIFLPLLTCLIVTRLVRSHHRSGRVDASSIPSGLRSRLRMLPDASFARGLALAAITTVVVAPLLLVLLHAAEVGDMAFGRFLLFKSSYAALLAALLQPFVALRALLDAEAPALASRASSEA